MFIIFVDLTLDRYIIHQFSNASISYPVGNLSVGPDVPVTTAYSAVAVTILPANTARSPEGLIINNGTKILWVSMTGSAATTASPSIPVPANGGTLDIPGSYTGAISGIWVAAGSGSCVVHEYSYV